MNRRDKCFILGRRLRKTSPAVAARAWNYLGVFLENKGTSYGPIRYNDIMEAIRGAQLDAIKDQNRHMTKS